VEAILNPLHESAEEGAASEQEPPSLIVGRDGENHWVVVETHGLCGGLFATEAAAMRYAREQSQGRPDAVRIAPYIVALNLQRAPLHRSLARR
jgi:crotonobetainyl-CoA:carnitine CoA-transferase CaiB-like acyl-CoA transferase